MQFFPAALQELADQFARLPGIGGKTAQRLAFHVLGLPLEEAEEFAKENPGIILTSGADTHTADTLCYAGIEADERIRNGAELVSLLRSGAYRLIKD